jgi:predicted Na+-dependent transporter
VLGNLVGIFVSPAWITALVAGPAQPEQQQGAAAAAAETTAAAAVGPPGAAAITQTAAIPYASVLGELGYLVLAPLAAGQLLQYFAPNAIARVRAKCNLADVSSLCIVLIVWLSFCNTFWAARKGKGTPATAADAAATFFLCLALLVAFAGIAWVAASVPVPDVLLRRRRRGGEARQANGKEEAAAAATTATTTAAAAPLPVVGGGSGDDAAVEEGRAAANNPDSATATDTATTTNNNSNNNTNNNTNDNNHCRCHPLLSRADRVAVVICGATKTLALGAPLISVMYGKSPDVGLVALPLVMYHAQQCVFGAPALPPLRRWRNGEAVWRRRGRKEAAAAGGGGE